MHTSATKLCAIVSVFALLLLASPLLAQRYAFNRANFPTGANPAKVAIADFNGDGKPDMAVTNFDDNTVSILLATSAGAFAPQQAYSTGRSPDNVVVADFNHDGIPDLATLNRSDNTISVLLGNGDGSFRSHVDYAVGLAPLGLVVADLDGDNKLDLATVSTNDNVVSVLYGNGDGSFQPQMTFPVAATPLSLATGDFNGDGRIDLVTANAGSATVTVLLSAGPRTFFRADFPSGIVTLPTNTAVAVGDFNRDGKLDVVVSDSTNQTLLLLLGNGDGTLGSPNPVGTSPTVMDSASILVFDFDQDGIPDLALGLSNNVAIFRGVGNGTFLTPVMSPVGTHVFSMAFGDLNHDGIVDVAVPDNTNNTVDVLLGSGTLNLSSSSTVRLSSTVYGPASAVTGDFNGDGKLDLAVAEINSPNGQVSVCLGNGDGTFQALKASPMNFMGTNNGALMFTGNFNSDAKTDLLFMDEYNQGFQVMLGNGDGTFQPALDHPLTTRLYALAIGDFNKDGKDDVVVTSNGDPSTPSSMTIYLNKGDGTFQAGATYPAGFYSSVAAADVNGDGIPDLIVNDTTTLTVFLGNGDGTFKALSPASLYVVRSSILVADFNHDGKPDLVMGTDKGAAFYAGNGDGTFRAAVFSPQSVINNGANVAFGDFNGDGELDVASNGTTGAVLILGNGDGTFTPGIMMGASGLVARLALADFDGDGKTDLAMANRNSLGQSVATVYLTSQTVTQPNFRIAASSGGTLSRTVAAGGTATFALQITPLAGFTGSVTVSCSSLPAGASCSAPSVNVTTGAAVPLTVNITTTARSVAAATPAPRHSAIDRICALSLAAPFVFGLLLTGGRRSQRRALALLLLIALTLCLMSCGSSGSGSSSSNPVAKGTPAGTYNIVVSATSGQITRSTTLTLTVN